MSEDPEGFTYSAGDRVARLGPDGSPDPATIGTIVDGSRKNLGDNENCLSVTYAVRVPGGSYLATELDLIDVEVPKTDRTLCPDSRCGSQNTRPLRGAAPRPDGTTQEQRRCEECEMWFWRIVPANPS